MKICRLSSTISLHQTLTYRKILLICTIYESYDDDEADCWEDSVSFGAQHNLNVGSVEQPWTKYLETAPDDENTPLLSSFPNYLSFMEMGCAESLKAYLDILDLHVHAEFAKKTKIIE